jgi:hypothetical protein
MSLTVEQLRRRCVAALKVAITASEEIGWCADCVASDDDGLCATHKAQFRFAEELREALVALAPETAPIVAGAA